jgi:hypothetical protein
MEQHPIPQNVTGFEFKLIGDMTIKQFAYLAGCLLSAYLFFASPLHPLLKFPLMVAAALLGIGLAFVPIEGRPLDNWIRNFIRAFFSPSQYLFHKHNATPQYLQNNYVRAVPTTSVKPLVKPSLQNSKFAQYIQTVTTTADAAQQDERLKNINDLLMTQPIAAPMPTVSTPAVPTPPIEVPQPEPAPIQMVPDLSTKEEETESNSADAKETEETNGPIVNMQQPTPEVVPVEQAGKVEDETKGTEVPEANVQSPVATPLAPHPLEEENSRLKEELDRLRQQFTESQKQPVPQQPITPIVPPAPVTPTPPIAPSIPSFTPTTPIDESTPSAAAFPVIRPVIPDVSKPKPLSIPLPKDGPVEPISLSAVQSTTPFVSSPPAAQTVPFTRTPSIPSFLQAPNIVSGIVKDMKGESLANIIVEVKDEHGNPVRAFKTNKLGHFSASTSLSNGKYTIEFEDAKNVYTFNTVQLELNGSIIQPINVIANDPTTSQRELLRSALFGGTS